jgi:hypothetical protein
MAAFFVFSYAISIKWYNLLRDYIFNKVIV